MKKKNRTVPFFLAVFFVSMIVLFTALTCYAADKQGLVGKGEPGEQIKEILVEQNVTLRSPVWCGENSFVITNEILGMRWVDFVNKKVVTIHPNPYVGAVDCTRDGSWLVYVDTRSSRYDKGTYERGVVDFWRYDLKTGQRQRFAIAQGGGEWSPDGKKFLFYGSKPQSSMEQPKPKWEFVCSKGDWSSGGGFEAQWLANSSSIVILYRDKLYIEKFGTKDPVKLIDIDLGDITHLKVDRSDRIYLISRLISRDKKRIEKGRLLRCIIKGDTLECKDALKRNNPILRYDITPDGKQIVFLEEGNTCAWYKDGDAEPLCLAQQAVKVNISPDGNWLAYVRHRKIGEQSGVDIVEDDLYVTRLESR